MFYKPLLYALLAQVALTALVWSILYISRISEMYKKGIDAQDLADKRNAEQLLARVSAPSDNFKNLFEAPVLFYVAMVLAMLLFLQSPLLVSLSWTYVLLRFIHSLIHISYNRVIHRFTAYFASTIVLWFIWGLIALEVLQR